MSNKIKELAKELLKIGEIQRKKAIGMLGFYIDKENSREKNERENKEIK